ncbi:MAG TPA: sigma-70 family RNA polymerase sigma factor [Vicinamibacterales bacterium]|nr:sigma-70 family RNA polymerase sigma factor [Vicinamibacterales bacterium]
MTDGDAERQLVEAAQQNPSHFAELYERHVDRVYAFVLARVRDRHVAEDLTADVFHKALAALPSFEWRGAPFGAWLIRIAANALADRRRRPTREVADLDMTGEQPYTDPAIDDFENRARLFRYVDELPDVQRTVIVERFAHERSVREVAAQLGKTEGAIKQIQLRALRALRLRMEGGHA